MVEKFGGKENFWIGLTDANTAGRWRWAGGEPVAYSNWAVDEPNNVGGESHGVMNWRAPGVWNDMNAASARQAKVGRAIVERPGGLADSIQRWRNEAPSAFDISGTPIAAPPDIGAGLPEALTLDRGLGPWARWSGVDTSRSHRGAEIVWDAARRSETIQFTRVGGGSVGSSVGIARDVHIVVADYDNLQLALDVKPMTHNLSGGGHASGHEYPVEVQLAYLDQHGVAHRWLHGFYSKGDDRYTTSSKIPAGQWHSYVSPPLSSLVPICADKALRAGHNRYHRSRFHAHDPSSRPAVITRVLLFGGGWNFSGRAANLRFAEGAQLAAGH